MKITSKKIGNEINLFLICFCANFFILWPLLRIGSNQWDFGEYLPILKEIFDHLIFRQNNPYYLVTVERGFGAWFIIIIPWLLIQSVRVLVWVVSLMKQAFVLLITKQGEIQLGRIFLIVLILGGSLLGGFWWWSQPDDPYYSVVGTNPENWHHSDRDNTSWKDFDVKECHKSVALQSSKEFLSWEDRVGAFMRCMREKSYEFVNPNK
ncbi:MAG: hypothetical protein WD425_13390 [Nitrospirales bacterium]